MLAWQPPLAGQAELKCVPLSEMYLASQALAFFKLVVDTQMLVHTHTGAHKNKLEDDAQQIWKYLVSTVYTTCYMYVHIAGQFSFSA
jgi:hypothetical protein